MESLGMQSPESAGKSSPCRHCRQPLQDTFLDLGLAPPSNAYLSAAQLLATKSMTERRSERAAEGEAPERCFPLKLMVCRNCWLVQTHEPADPDELFAPDYAYFSSTSTSWLEHARRYSQMIIERLKLGPKSRVIEVAANDGYLLRNFLAAGIPCLGIEPTAGTAQAAEKLGIPVLRAFFGQQLAQDLAAQGLLADLIIGNNVYAHVPDVNDFTAGLKTALRPGGTLTLEFPHLLRLIEDAQFDTAYHEHFSYFSLYTVERIFSAAGLRVVDVEQLPTHGGSLRVYGGHENDDRDGGEVENVREHARDHVREHVRAPTPAVAAVRAAEERAGLRTLAPYREFQARADRIRDELLAFLDEQRRAGLRVAGYGAAAKGCTLLNYAGVKTELLPYVCDAAPSKQGKFLPGSHIPVVHPEVLRERRPDIILILPWNLREELVAQLDYARAWGARFAVAVPALTVF
jgi:SAM-dependent methyltransferase